MVNRINQNKWAIIEKDGIIQIVSYEGNDPTNGVCNCLGSSYESKHNAAEALKYWQANVASAALRFSRGDITLQDLRKALIS